VPAASVSQDEPCFSYDMWRGPAWPNVNVLLYHGLMDYRFLDEARALARATCAKLFGSMCAMGVSMNTMTLWLCTNPPNCPARELRGAQGGVGFGVVADLQ